MLQVLRPRSLLIGVAGVGGSSSWGLSLGGELKSRLVLITETPSTLLESTFAQPITALLEKVKGKICTGRVLTASGYKEVVSPLRDYDHVKALDWSGFDSWVMERPIVVAFGVMRAHLHGNDVTRKDIFSRFLSHSLVKWVVTPGGWVHTILKRGAFWFPLTLIVGSLSTGLCL